MQDLPALASLYSELDAHLEGLRWQAITASDTRAVERIEAKQLLNDQAYFVLCWGQLEVTIDDMCRAAIRTRTASADWMSRRAWDLYNPDDRRLSGLSFNDRVALVLDRSGGPGSAWARVQSLYALRNQIAHGRLQSQRIEVTAVVGELYQIQGALSA